MLKTKFYVNELMSTLKKDVRTEATRINLVTAPYGHCAIKRFRKEFVGFDVSCNCWQCLDSGVKIL